MQLQIYIIFEKLWHKMSFCIWRYIKIIIIIIILSSDLNL